MHGVSCGELLGEQTFQHVLGHLRRPVAHGQHILGRIAEAETADSRCFHVYSAGIARRGHAVDRAPYGNHPLKLFVRQTATALF